MVKAPLSGADKKLARMGDVCAVSTFDSQPLLRQLSFSAGNSSVKVYKKVRDSA